ncbi:MAG TPA: hypothetical protein VJP76_03905, partial [Candidatus Tumulicola sp.]|nr:hypothetical protein [Candidatus Tumulicola sp.]
MILLDTCAIVWSAQNALPSRVRARVNAAAREGELFWSPISAWEIATLARKGRLRLDEPVEAFLDRMGRHGARIAAITLHVAQVAGSFGDTFG